MPNVTEAELGLGVMKVLAGEADRKAHVRTLVEKVPNFVVLTEEDREESGTRPGEEIWEQRVRNLKSHDKTEGNVLAEGYVRHVGKGTYQLTDAGLLHLKNIGFL